MAQTASPFAGTLSGTTLTPLAAQCGTTGTVTLSTLANNNEGYFTVTPNGTGIAAGDAFLTMNFPGWEGYEEVPQKIFDWQPMDKVTYLLGLYPVSFTPTSLTLGCTNVPTAAQAYKIGYQVSGTL